jgi:proteic killer suppression protein
VARAVNQAVIDTLGVIGCILSVDVRFGADKLRRAYEDEKTRTREWGRVVARLYVQRIDTLYAAENAQTLRALQSLRFHALTGQRKGQYAVDLGPAYRLILAFQDRAMTVVQVEEVSKHHDD